MEVIIYLLGFIVVLLLVVLFFLFNRNNKLNKGLIKLTEEINMFPSKLAQARVKAVDGFKSDKLGKLMERFCPIGIEYATQYESSDIVALYGDNPCDLIVFKGKSKGVIEEVIFQEVKSSKNSSILGKKDVAYQLRDFIQQCNSPKIRFELWYFDQDTMCWRLK